MPEEYVPFEAHFQHGQYATVAIPWEQLEAHGAAVLIGSMMRAERELKTIEHGGELFERRERYLAGELKLKRPPSIDDYPAPRYVTGVKADVLGRETVITLVAKGMRA